MNMLLRTPPFDGNKKTPESSSSSSSNNSAHHHHHHHHHHSDEEEVRTTYLLASSRPKKRAGRRVFKETRHPVYRGVRRRNGNKWVCEMRVPNNNKSRIWLGTYPTPEMAARAHDVAALALRAKSTACLNFADSAWRLPVPDSTNAEDIRKAAVEAAKAFAPPAEDNNNNNNNNNQLQQQQQESVMSTSTTDHYYEDACSMGMEDDAAANNKGDNNTLQQLQLGVPQYEDFHDLIMSLADEPLRSPNPFARDAAAAAAWDWNDVDILDDNNNNNNDDMSVSLWSFSF
ncbi:hypothetical protein RIF29_37403 [Crotalaria pallida]|uniref:AP2/ERF domain-containing protein n=1 Tax=Crotalaria pallida TaxID=3830 RepID=A0AAN9EEC7_CROPI